MASDQAAVAAELPAAAVLRKAVEEIDRLLTRSSAGWQAFFTTHGDPFLAPPDKPWRTSMIAEVSTSAPDYGRANCLLLGAAGPDHWQTVRDLFQQAIEQTRLVAAVLGEPPDSYAATSSVITLLRPLAEQVLHHIAVRP